jgi:hypothetical protein
MTLAKINTKDNKKIGVMSYHKEFYDKLCAIGIKASRAASITWIKEKILNYGYTFPKNITPDGWITMPISVLREWGNIPTNRLLNSILKQAHEKSTKQLLIIRQRKKEKERQFFVEDSPGNEERKNKFLKDNDLNSLKNQSKWRKFGGRKYFDSWVHDLQEFGVAYDMSHLLCKTIAQIDYIYSNKNMCNDITHYSISEIAKALNYPTKSMYKIFTILKDMNLIVAYIKRPLSTSYRLNDENGFFYKTIKEIIKQKDTTKIYRGYKKIAENTPRNIGTKKRVFGHSNPGTTGTKKRVFDTKKRVFDTKKRVFEVPKSGCLIPKGGCLGTQTQEPQGSQPPINEVIRTSNKNNQINTAIGFSSGKINSKNKEGNLYQDKIENKKNKILGGLEEDKKIMKEVARNMRNEIAPEKVHLKEVIYVKKIFSEVSTQWGVENNFVFFPGVKAVVLEVICTRIKNRKTKDMIIDMAAYLRKCLSSTTEKEWEEYKARA